MLCCHSYLTQHDTDHRREGFWTNTLAKANLTLIEVFSTSLALCVCVWARGWIFLLFTDLKRLVVNPNLLRWWFSKTEAPVDVAGVYLGQSRCQASGWKLTDVLALLACLGVESQGIAAPSTEALSSAADLWHLQRHCLVLVNENHVFPWCFQICHPVSNCPTLPNQLYLGWNFSSGA